MAMTEKQAEELRKFIEQVTFDDCERLTDSYASAGALFEALRVVLMNYCQTD